MSLEMFRDQILEMAANPVIKAPPGVDREGFIAATFGLSYENAEEDYREALGLIRVYEKIMEAGEE